jgi:hypothetical protein
MSSTDGKQDIDALLSDLKEMEELLQFPGVAGHMQKSLQLAMGIARRAPRGDISNLAMRVISEALALRSVPLPLKPDRGTLNKALWRLRIALQEVKSRPNG